MPRTRVISTSLSLPASYGPMSVDLSKGRPLFVLGRNGTGKSALVHHLVNQLSANLSLKLIYIPGSRPSYFDSDSLSMTAQTRQQFESNSRAWDSSPDVRIRPVNGTIKNERAIFDLQSSEIQYKVDAADAIAQEGRLSKAIDLLQTKSSPIHRVNRLLKQANLPVQVVIDNGELRASRNGVIYSISKMSDGERTALIIISDIISAKEGSIFVIDEPELHLHPSIVVPLITALINERQDCSLIVSTHELNLPVTNPDSSIILVRGCIWQGPTVQSWDLDFLPQANDIPEDVRVDLIGSRRLILFIEGKDTSLDQPLYALLYPKVSLSCRETCTEVRRAVEGLRQVQSMHNAEAYGLVDNDSMDSEFEQKLIASGIYPLQMLSVESLYYSPEVLDAVAGRQATTFTTDKDALLATAKYKAIDGLTMDRIQHLAARVAERHMRDEVLRKIPSRSDMIGNADGNINLSILSPYPKALEILTKLVSDRDIDTIIARYPVRESHVLRALTQGLKFAEVADYEQAALTAIATDEILKNKIRAKLGLLSDKLE